MGDSWYNPSLAGPSSGQMFHRPNRVEFHEGSQPHFTNVHGNADTHVHSVATGHQPNGMNGFATGMENTTSSFLDATCGIWSESASYCGQLLRQGRGCPLYIPGPPGNLPNDYKLNGVSIGDVGRVTPDGAFDFFFNIYLEADHPINANYVPDDFSPLKKHCITRDIIPSDQDPGNHVSTSSVQKLEPDDPQFEEFPGGHFIFSCGAPQGAVLALPQGAHLEKLENLETLRPYVAKHAESWYQYIRGTRGRGLENGSLYLVTGWEKAPSWGMASFHSVGEEFQLMFKPTATTLTPRADSTSIDHTPSYKYRWRGISGRKNPAQTKRCNPSSTNGPLNQTTFIHGLSISVGTGIWAALFGKVKICEIVKFQSGGANGNFISHTNGSSSSSSSPGASEGGGGGGGTTNGRTHHTGESGHVVLSNLAPISKIFHPGELINNYILQKTPQASVVMSHDDDWRDILRDDPSTGPPIQNVSELLQRIDDQFSITEKDGATFLLPTPAPSTSDEVGHISPTTPLETHPSTWLAEEHLPTPGSLIVSQSEQAPAAVKELAENAILDSTANTQHTFDVAVGEPDAGQDKINADTDAHSVQPMSPLMPQRPWAGSETSSTRLLSRSPGRSWFSSSSLFSSDPDSVSLTDSDQPYPKLLSKLEGFSIEDETSLEQSYSNYRVSPYDTPQNSRFARHHPPPEGGSSVITDRPVDSHLPPPGSATTSIRSSPFPSSNYSLEFDGISVEAGRSSSQFDALGFDADYNGDSRRLAARTERRSRLPSYFDLLTSQAERGKAADWKDSDGLGGESAGDSSNHNPLFTSPKLGDMNSPTSHSNSSAEPNEFPISRQSRAPYPQQRLFDPTGGSPHRSPFGSQQLNTFSFSPTPGSAELDNGFLSPESGLRYSKSYAAARPTDVSQSLSEDIRSGSELFPYEGGGNDFLRSSSQYLSPVEPPPSIRGHRHYRSASSGGSGSGGSGSQWSATSSRSSAASSRWGAASSRWSAATSQWSAASSQRPSPHPSPNVSPAPHYSDLPDVSDPSAAPIVVSKQNVTTVPTSKASHNWRKQEATFICPVPGCGSTFTRVFNLKGHIRSHNEEKPFLCKCGKGFTRKQDCKRHEQLHTQFARMDALNRHLRSEGGAECQRTLEASGPMPTPNDGDKDRSHSYSAGIYHEPESSQPPHLTMPAGVGGGVTTEDRWMSMTNDPPTAIWDISPSNSLFEKK